MPANNNLIMPYNREAEQSVLGSILIEPSCIETAMRILKADSFYLPEHQQIFSAMWQLYNQPGSAIDHITVADTLEKGEYSGSVSIRDYILQLAEIVPSTANVQKYCEIVRENYYLREIMQIAQRAIDNAGGSGVSSNTLIESMEQQLYDLREGNADKRPKSVREVIFGEVYDKLKKLSGANAKDYKGIPTGFGLLDKYLTGLNKSDLILIGARPAMGKTSFALNLAHNISVAQNKKCIFFSLEMTNGQLAERLLASQSGIESTKFRTGELNDEEWVRLGNAASSFYDTPLYLSDISSITVPEMKAIVRRERDVDCVIIDYLGLVQSAEKTENRVQEVTKITKDLKMMAKDLNIPVVCCAQLSRGTEGRGKNHRPQLSDLRESGSIEQDADIVMFLYREDYYSGEKSEEEQDTIDKNKTELIIAKNRHGSVGTVPLVFDSEFTRFRAVDLDNGYDFK